MKEFFVYRIKSENRLVILKQRIDSSDYIELMNNNGNDESTLLAICKSFCVGYIMGAKIGLQVVNSLNEFF